MINVGFTSVFPNWPIDYQFPGRRPVWGNYYWNFNPEYLPESTRAQTTFNYWVVYEEMIVPQATFLCPPENTIFIAQEHNDHYDQGFLDQFSTVISHQPLKHRNLVRAIPGATWLIHRTIGVNGPDTFMGGYDELKALHPVKTKLLSVIASVKSQSRLDFARKIKAHFGGSCDLFGGGVNFIPSKWDAIAPYKYHVALENFMRPYILSEKLTDSYLGEAFPFYRGAPNVGDYFPMCAVLPKDDDDAAIEYIEAWINDDVYERAKPTLLEYKQLVLDKYNMFPLIISIIEECGLNPNATPQMVTLYKNKGK